MKHVKAATCSFKTFEKKIKGKKNVLMGHLRKKKKNTKKKKKKKENKKK